MSASIARAFPQATRMKPKPVFANQIARKVEEMISEAVTFCAQKMGFSQRDQAILKLHKGDPRAHEYFRYELARQISDHLGTLDHNLKAVYLIDGDNLKPATAGITLIAWTNHRNQHFQAMVDLLDEQVVEQYRVLMAPIANGMRHFLNVHQVDDDDVAQGTGLGALLSAQHELPQNIWSR